MIQKAAQPYRKGDRKKLMIYSMLKIIDNLVTILSIGYLASDYAPKYLFKDE